MDSKEFGDKSTLLAGLAMLLQSCEKEEELFDVTFWYLPILFPNTSGTIYLGDDEKDNFSVAFSWPDQHEKTPLPAPQTCLAFTDGSAIGTFQNRSTFCGKCGSGTHCIPFKEGKKSFGVFCLKDLQKQPLSLPYYGLVFITAEYLALAMVNIRLKKRLQEMAIRDPLTKLYNRRHMDEVIIREIRKAERSNCNIGIIMIDLDHFKQFNDSFGHEAGDMVLVEISTILAQEFRLEDMVYRYGGEEFLVLLAGGTYEDYLARAQTLLHVINTHKLTLREKSIGPITASLGVAAYPNHGKTLPLLLKAADQALYQAKHLGRNQVVGRSDLVENC